MAEPLALEGASGSSSAIDSLAYIDTLTPADKQLAEALIDKELESMKREGKKADQYTAGLKPASSFLAFEVCTACSSLRVRWTQPVRHPQLPGWHAMQ